LLESQQQITHFILDTRCFKSSVVASIFVLKPYRIGKVFFV
jgi:hypothetical protein